jgi:D-hexose-6-phosphate mutarotase
MSTTQRQENIKLHSQVLFSQGNGNLPKLEVKTPWSSAEIYLHGAHVTRFQQDGQPPVLFMSHASRFAEGQPIRGGIPVIFPWFGPKEGEAAHGFARVQTWELKEITQAPTGEVLLRLSLPDSRAAAQLPKFTAEYLITVGQTLAVQLVIANISDNRDLTFEDCLHTYFQVEDIAVVSISGLRGVDYLDKVENFARKTERSEQIKISQEVDRVYLDTAGPVEVVDAKLGRRIRSEKSGSQSTVVWNPWVAKSQQMPDFGAEEFHQMVCVESGNVADNRLTLPPGTSHTLRVEISTLPL